ncbi:MAG: ribosomal protein S18-alanine N-acetyltransferase [Pyrinomonadaceae bacterium]
MTPDAPRICSVESSHIAELISIGELTNLSPWSAQSYLDEMKNPNAIMLRLVTNDNETAGFVVGRLVPGGEIERQMDAEIYNIAVLPDHQRKKYGQQLLGSFLDHADACHASCVWLEVRESNKKAIQFYKKHGFEQVQSRPNFYENPREAALLMRLKLSSEKS